MLMFIALFALIAVGLYFLVRGRKAFPDAPTVSSLSELHMFTKSGTVIDSQSRTETAYRSTTTGGSTLLADGIGTVSPPTTTTTASTVEVIRIFLREGNGAEFEAEVDNLGFGVRPGHEVTVIYAGDQASQQGHPMGLSNRTTNQSAILSHRVEWLLRRKSATLGCAALAVIPFLSMLFGGIVLNVVLGQDPRSNTGNGILVGIVVFAIIGIWLWRSRQQAERLKAEIVATLQRQLALH
jgi:hypothetical protein